MFDGGVLRQAQDERKCRNAQQQEAMIADLEAISRRRPLSAQESDLLADLIRRSNLRQWWRDRRRGEQLERAQRRLQQLGAVPA